MYSSLSVFISSHLENPQGVFTQSVWCFMYVSENELIR